MANAYSGQLVRQQQSSHYAGHVSVAGVVADHTKPSEDPDPFEPVPEGVQDRPGDVWQPADLPTHTPMRDEPITHWTTLHAPIPTNVPRETLAVVSQTRMLANHAAEHYRPDQYPLYKHASQGREIHYTPGRAPWVAGETVPEGSAYLQAGTNAYDSQNEPNEVYSDGESNVGRYRLGVGITDFGRYEFHTAQGQDALLRAYSGLTPMFPVDRPRVENSAPYVPNSSGTTNWLHDAFQAPSFFALPSETSMTDRELSDQAGSEFVEDGRL